MLHKLCKSLQLNVASKVFLEQVVYTVKQDTAIERLYIPNHANKSIELLSIFTYTSTVRLSLYSKYAYDY